MSEEKRIKSSTVRVVKGDITATEVEAFVFYARPDLKLGAGFGNAISVRGGPTIQKELDAIGRVAVGTAVVTGAGNLKAKYIIHAVGPTFLEENLEEKLRRTILSVLQQAEEKGIRQVAFPPMGAGFYGVSLDKSVEITLNTIKTYLEGETALKEIVLVAVDGREYRPFQARLTALA